MRSALLPLLLALAAAAGLAARAQTDSRPLVFHPAGHPARRRPAAPERWHAGTHGTPLPAELPVQIYLTTRNEYTRIHEGPAGQLAWPPAGFALTVTSPATTPYRNLLKFPRRRGARRAHRGVHHQRPIGEPVPPGRHRGLHPGSRFVRAVTLPAPARSGQHCKEHQIRLVGLLVSATGPRLQPDLLRVVNDAFNYGINGPGGWAYSNFTTFTSVFNSLLKKGRLQP